MTPKVSVIIPTYNRAAKVATAIDSALNQTFRDLEVIVVDDGSSDNTGEVLREAYGDRIRYFSQQNQGASAARNKGLAEARGEWIALLDSDDFWEKDKIEQQFKALKQAGPQCGASYTDVRFLNYRETRTMFRLAEESYRHEGTAGISPDVMDLLVKPGGAGMVVCTCALMARADIVAKAGGFDTSLSFGEDSEFMFRIATLTDYCYVNLPLVWIDRSPAEIRHVGVSSEWDKMDVKLRDAQRKFEGLLRLENVPNKTRKLIREQLGAVQSGWANWYLETGDYAKARESALKATQLSSKPSLAAKLLLTWISPRLALQAIKHRQQAQDDNARFV